MVYSKRIFVRRCVPVWFCSN